jgi:hypothetical protein
MHPGPTGRARAAPASRRPSGLRRHRRRRAAASEGRTRQEVAHDASLRLRTSGVSKPMRRRAVAALDPAETATRAGQPQRALELTAETPLRRSCGPPLGGMARRDGSHRRREAASRDLVACTWCARRAGELLALDGPYVTARLVDLWFSQVRGVAAEAWAPVARRWLAGPSPYSSVGFGVRFAPHQHGVEDAGEAAALLRQGVHHPWRHLGVDRAGQDPLMLQRP